MIVKGRLRTAAAWSFCVSAFLWAHIDHPIVALWPSITALGVVLLVRRVLIGLVAGGAAGCVIIAGGNPVVAFVSFFRDHLIPSLQDSWKIGAIIFTFVLGGFAALIERGGGMRALVGPIVRRGKDPAARMQWGVFTIGFAVFFDGLANSMLVGRIFGKVADRSGVSRAKLAYLVDSTSSAVACVAFVSTWIAYQLAMIREGYALAGRTEEAKPYTLFFESIPFNFYCWFTLLLVGVSIYQRFNPGPMAQFEAIAQSTASKRERHRGGFGATGGSGAMDDGHWAVAVIPLVVLIVTLIGGIYFWGDEIHPWPVTKDKVVAAFGGSHVVVARVCASAVGAFSAFLMYPRRRRENKDSPAAVFQGGVQTLFIPVTILLGAWVLGSTLKDLKAAVVISELLSGRLPVQLFPAAVFLTGAAISFSTGTSWGTMGILMPLAIPVVFGLDVGSGENTLMAAVVGAVFSGAVFGDHCSPISDTTIVSSIACEIPAHDHVRTQLPYALIAGGTAVFLGFLPTGFFLPAWISLGVGSGFLILLPRVWARPR